MRILQLTNKIPYPPKDGGAIATLNLSKGLARYGHEIDILGMNTSKHFVDLNHLPEDITQLVSIYEVRIDTHLFFWDALKNLVFSEYPYNAERFFNQTFTNALVEVLQKKQYDIIQLEGLYLAYYIETIRKYSTAKIALRAHNIEHEIWERNAQHEKSIIKKWYLNKLSRRIKRFKLDLINQYDLLVPITERDAIQYNALGNTKPLLVVPAGFDMSLKTPSHQVHSFPSVFFIGALDWFPNQEGLVWFLEKVWPKLLQKHPSLIFHIAGRNAPNWLRKIIERCNNIHFEGEIEDAHQFINQHAVMIAPLFSGSGMRVKIIEGMALGKTIVTTSIGAEGIDVVSGKNILIEDNEQDFLKRIDQVLTNRSFFDSIGQEAFEFVKNRYDNHQISGSLAKFYEQHL
jgi:polysaccharide biosynthesis protein PslH